MAKFDIWLTKMRPSYLGINKHGHGYAPAGTEYLGVYIANTVEEAEELAAEVTNEDGIFKAEKI